MSHNPFDEVNKNITAIQQQVINLTELIKKLLATEQDNDELGNIDLAVKITGLKKATIYCHIGQNKIPHFKRGGKLYFSKKALQNWIMQKPFKNILDIKGEQIKLPSKNNH